MSMKNIEELKKLACDLVFKEKYNQTKAAKMTGISQATISKAVINFKNKELYYVNDVLKKESENILDEYNELKNNIILKYKGTDIRKNILKKYKRDELFNSINYIDKNNIIVKNEDNKIIKYKFDNKGNILKYNDGKNTFNYIYENNKLMYIKNEDDTIVNKFNYTKDGNIKFESDLNQELYYIYYNIDNIEIAEIKTVSLLNNNIEMFKQYKFDKYLCEIMRDESSISILDKKGNLLYRKSVYGENYTLNIYDAFYRLIYSQDNLKNITYYHYGKDITYIKHNDKYYVYLSYSDNIICKIDID